MEEGRSENSVNNEENYIPLSNQSCHRLLKKGSPLMMETVLQYLKLLQYTMNKRMVEQDQNYQVQMDKFYDLFYKPKPSVHDKNQNVNAYPNKGFTYFPTKAPMRKIKSHPGNRMRKRSVNNAHGRDDYCSLCGTKLEDKTTDEITLWDLNHLRITTQDKTGEYQEILDFGL